MMPKRFMAVLKARNTEFLRDRSALAWNIVLPVMIVIGFAFVFSGGQLDLYKVGIHGGAATGDALPAAEFFHTDHIEFVPIADLAAAVTKIERHQLDMLFDLEGGRYWVNDQSPRGYMLERVLHGTSPGLYARERVSGREIRYVDWLVPGILAMNMMFSSLFGVGYVIVRYRKNGVLKRLSATPLSALEFLSAQIVSRLLLIVSITVVVFIGTDLLVDFAMFGSYLTLFLVFALGAMCLISLGLLLAARIASEELAGGLLNMISWPMMFLSGVWFSLEGLHPVWQRLALLLPLTHVIDAARAIMIDGAGLVQVLPHVLALVGMTALFMVVGAGLFRWE